MQKEKEGKRNVTDRYEHLAKDETADTPIAIIICETCGNFGECMSDHVDGCLGWKPDKGEKTE